MVGVKRASNSKDIAVDWREKRSMQWHRIMKNKQTRTYESE
jgi:hypothetical protein